MIRQMSAIERLLATLDLFRARELERPRPHLEPEDRMPGARQATAVVLRQKKNRQDVLLITSRDTARWILPKGWIEDDERPSQAAIREAWEEAGVICKDVATPLGSYEYVKIRPQRGDLFCQVDIYQLSLREEKRRWPEMHERKRKWVPLSDALKAIEEPALVRELARSPLFKRTS